MCRFLSIYRFVTVPFCDAVPFCNVPFRNVPLCNVLLRNVTFCNLPFCNVPLFISIWIFLSIHQQGNYHGLCILIYKIQYHRYCNEHCFRETLKKGVDTNSILTKLHQFFCCNSSSTWEKRSKD
jgi:hypothetical protein